jgi:integrase
MRKIVLTDLKVKNLKPPVTGGRSIIWDANEPNLGVRVTERGKRSFILVRRPVGGTKPVWYTLGTYPEMSLAQARDEARRIRIILETGKTPQEVEDEKRRGEAERRRAEEERLQHTFAAIAEQFIKRYLRHLRSAKPTESLIRSTLIPRFGEIPIVEIKRREIIKLVEEVGETRGPAIARATLGVTSKMFNWCLSLDLVGLEFNPASRIRSVDIVGPAVARDRVLSDEELRLFWDAAIGMGYPFGTVHRLLALTGQRLHEISDLTWTEVDFQRRIITLPAERVKGKNVHVVPLAQAAFTLLCDLPRFSEGNFVFTTTGGRRPIGALSQAKAKLDAAIAQVADIPHWRVHDLRRTVRTNLAATGILPVIAEVVLAHRQRGISAVYDRHTYLEEKRDALEQWETRLAQIVGNNIVPLRPVVAS